MKRSTLGILGFVLLLGITWARANAGWIIVCDDNTTIAAGLGDELSQKLAELKTRGAAIKSVSFSPGGGWVVLHDRNGNASSHIPKAAAEKLAELSACDAELKSITFTPWWEGRGWIILHDKAGHAEG